MNEQPKQNILGFCFAEEAFGSWSHPGTPSEYMLKIGLVVALDIRIMMDQSFQRPAQQVSREFRSQRLLILFGEADSQRERGSEKSVRSL